MERDDAYLIDMLDSAKKALSFVSGIDKNSFRADEVKQLAIVRLIQIVGEAARGVSPECRAQHSDIPWSEIVGMRHRLVHDYWNIDFEVVWDTITNDLQPLVITLEQIVGDAPAS